MRILFASLGSLGDLFPMLALATAARDRGHTASVAAPALYEKRVKELGMEFTPLRPDFPEAVLKELFSDPLHGADKMMSKLVFPAAKDTYNDLLGAAKEVDFMVAGELVYVASLVGAKLGIPWANAVLSPISLFSAYDPCLMSSAPQVYPLRHLGAWPQKIIYALGRRKTSKWAEPLIALQKEIGVGSGLNPIFDGKYSPMLVLTMFPSFFASPQIDWPKAAVQTGFPYFVQPPQPEAAQKIREFVAAGEAPIVFTLGSTAVYLANDFYQIAADVVMELGKRAILLIAQNTPPNAPADRILSLPFAPLDIAVQGSSAVVHHGGIGCCAEVLRVGVPALVIPFGADQPDNAARLGRLGTALTLKRNSVSREALKAKLQELFAHAGIKAKAQQVAKEIDAQRTLTQSIEAMEKAAAAAKK